MTVLLNFETASVRPVFAETCWRGSKALSGEVQTDLWVVQRDLSGGAHGLRVARPELAVSPGKRGVAQEKL